MASEAQLVSINLGQRESLTIGGRSRPSGIFKRPVEGPILIERLGLTSDAVVNTKHHGGEDQAVYIYRVEDYAWWSQELGRTLAPGTFGENLTMAGLPSAGLFIGSRLEFETVTLQVTAPREPCNTLATRMEDKTFVKRFFAAKRPGYYARVLREGEVSTGALATLSEPDGPRVSTLELFEYVTPPKRKPSEADRLRFLAAPIDIRTRRKLERS